MDWWRNSKHIEIVKQIKNEYIDISIPAELFNGWVGYARQEPYAAVIRESLGVCKKGKNADPFDSEYQNTFIRVKEFVHWINEHGKLIAKVIANESIAHRWSDHYLESPDDLYESKMIYHYHAAHYLALEGGYWKNVDSSIFWLGEAYNRALTRYPHLDISHKCLNCYKLVVNRDGPRFNQKMHMRKIRKAKRIILAMK